MRKFLVTLAVFAAVFLIVSCGGTENSSNNNNETINNGNNEEENTDENSEGVDTDSNNNDDFSDSFSDGSEQPDNSDSGEEEQYKQGDLYGECYPNETCNKGLVCDVEHNICITDPNNSNENNDPKEDPCKNNPCAGISNSTGVCSTDGVYKYSCECKTNYTWNGSQCKANTKSATCTGLPKNAIWNIASNITQTWNGYDWIPSSTGSYNETSSSSECRFICRENFFWSGSECLNPCNNNPCSAIENSTDLCVAINSSDYYCGCQEGYEWREEKCDAIPKVLGRICTGQDKCYNESLEITCPTSPDEQFFGQDVQYAEAGKCLPQNFVIETVSDRTFVKDLNTGLIWTRTPALNLTQAAQKTWGNAASYCNALNLADRNDWRLPSPQELLTIIDISKYDPALDTEYFSGLSELPTSTTPGLFWTSKTYQGNTGSAFALYVSTGHLQSWDKNDKNYVICVSGDEMPTGSFTTSTKNGDEIVIDSTTKLMWTKTHSSSDKKWKDALEYCENLTYAGFSDWRLPNKNELASLVNFDNFNPVSDFPNIRKSDYWSSSTKSNTAKYGWEVSFGYGTVGDYSSDKGNYNNVICVR